MLADLAGRDQRGFTLTELMVVVVITGILASLGFIALKKHTEAAWHVEGLNVVQSIRAAEERWRAEHMAYLDVSSPGDSWYPFDPRLGPNRRKVSSFYYPPSDPTHPDNDEWLLLRPTAPNSVRFGFMVNAGSAGQPWPVPAVAGSGIAVPVLPDHNWYLIQAIGDTDWDGEISYYAASSLDGHVYSKNDGE